MFRDSCEKAIFHHIYSADPGIAYAMSDFGSFGSYDAIRQALSRLTQKLLLVRIVPGIYCRPVAPTDEMPSLPSSREIAYAIARNCDWQILPGTELARHILGLAEAPPTHPTYLSTGPNSRYKFGQDQRLYMVHTAGKFLSALPYEAALVISALMDLDHYKITVAEVNHLAQSLSPETKDSLLKNLTLAPPRLRPIIELMNDQYGKAGR